MVPLAPTAENLFIRIFWDFHEVYSGSGFIGCVRNFYVDSELYNLASFITQQEVQMPRKLFLPQLSCSHASSQH